jgi:hypothetical protein
MLVRRFSNVKCLYRYRSNLKLTSNRMKSTKQLTLKDFMKSHSPRLQRPSDVDNPSSHHPMQDEADPNDLIQNISLKFTIETYGSSSFHRMNKI